MTAIFNTVTELGAGPLTGGPHVKAPFHPLVRPVTKTLFDFTDPNCHPAGVITPGATSSGEAWTGLTDAAVTATVSGAAWAVNADGSLSPPGGGGSLQIGAAGQFDLSSTNPTPETLAVFWFKPTAVPASYSRFLAFSDADSFHGQMTIDSGFSTSNLNIRGSVGGQASNTATGLSTGLESPGLALNQVHQVAVSFVPGVKVELFIDGVSAAIGTYNPPTTFNTAAAAFLQVGANWQGKLYGLSYHDLTASKAAEAAAGLTTAQIMTASRHVARDYAFATGALPGALYNAFAA